MDQFLISAGIALICSVAAGLLLLPMLRKLKVGQRILDVGPNWHKTKEGTPTMGGFIFMTAVTVATLTMVWKHGNIGIYILIFAWVCGCIGFIDDFCKIRNKRNKGLSAPQKLLLQLSAAAAFLALSRYFGYTTTELHIPFTGISVTLPWFAYLTLGILFVAGFINAVNITDGIDGLCTGVTIPAAVLFGAMAVSFAVPGISVFAGALAGGLAGFLFFNFNPAKVFMGDTGSLFLGGALCGLAFALDQPLILIVCGLIYCLTILSVVIQVAFFKLTGGKRVFKMAPVHHHFEMCGWKEKKLFFVYTTISIILCVIAWFGV
jgi:phospho-N-acetylmuramoyl-pentapeptide-transferase